MTLMFENLTIRNFGPYRDIPDLDLRVDASSPVVLIYGENTLGKTRLFRALRWCLYGSPTLDKTPLEAQGDLKQYLNYRAASDGDNQMEVSIQFRAEGKTYRLSRQATFSDEGLPDVISDLRIDATVMPPNMIDSEIGRLLHPQISEFFLFDGELLSQFYDRLNTDRESDLIRSHIDTVLGIPALRYAQNDIDDLADEANAKQIKAVDNDEQRREAEENLATLTSQRRSVEKDRDELQEDLQKRQKQLKDVVGKMLGIEHLQADAREIQDIEAQIETGKKDEDRLRGEMKELISGGWLAVVAGVLAEKLSEVRAANDSAVEKSKAIRDAKARVETLEKRLSGGNCETCNQPLPPPNEATRTELDAAKAALAEFGDDQETEPNINLERQLTAMIDSTTIERYAEKQRGLDAIRIKQFVRRQRLETLQDNLRDNKAADIRALAEERVALGTVISGLETQLSAIQPKLDEISTRYEQTSRKISKLPGPQPAVKASALYYGYLKAILFRTIERYRDKTRLDVQAAATDMFLKLIRDPEGYGGIRISPTYKVELIGSDGVPMLTSAGGEQLLALSLIGALKGAAVRGGPVVLDSPLGRLDTEHRERVLDVWVPSLGDQVALLVQSGELTQEDARKTLGSRIGHEYRIYRPKGDPNEAVIEKLEI